MSQKNNSTSQILESLLMIQAGNEDKIPSAKHPENQEREMGAKWITFEKAGMKKIKRDNAIKRSNVNTSLRLKTGNVSKRINPIFPKRRT